MVSVTAKIINTKMGHPGSLLYKKRGSSGAQHSSGVVCESRCESRWPSWAVRPNEPSGFRGRKAILNHASALVSACP